VSEETARAARSLITRLHCESLFGTELPSHSAEHPAESLDTIAAEIHSCTLCPLAESRTHAVPGEGNPSARIVFVGEGPGRDEDLQGRPFIGRAGRLLDRMMAAIGLDRTSAYIANVVKCRPPNNRTPTTLEAATCIWYLKRQLALIRPAVVCSLGTVATAALLERHVRITAVRGQQFAVNNFTLVPTYHPAYLLRNPSGKKEAWHDLQLARRLLDQQA
jgi:uracil-DNA glycosylase family 4